ncbi:MAG: Flp pilus assembly protein CpaB, partial [Mesorhizobium sp.]
IMTRRADAAGGGSGFTTETILKNIRVLAIDQTIQEDEEGKSTRVGQTATLELTPQQAEIITVAQQMADRLTLALRSISDTQEKNLDEADYLVSGNGRRGTVRLIKSGEVSEVGARQ